MKNYSRISTDNSDQEVLLQEVEKTAASEKIPVISREVGHLLSSIVFTRKPDSILEIGCGIGYSTYFLLKNIKDTYYCGIDLNKKRLKKAEVMVNGVYGDVEAHFLPGNALKIIPGLKKSFELVFIDAAKYEYPLYLRSVLGLLKKGSIIIADDVFYKGIVFEREISSHDANSVKGIRDYLDIIETDKCFDNIYLDISDGIAISIFKGDLNRG